MNRASKFAGDAFSYTSPADFDARFIDPPALGGYLVVSRRSPEHREIFV